LKIENRKLKNVEFMIYFIVYPHTGVGIIVY